MNDITESQDFLVITGSPRSGSYLLAGLLENSFGIATPIQANLIPIFARLLFLWGDLGKAKNRKRLLAAMREFLIIWIYYGIRTAQPAEMAKMSLLLALEEKADTNFNAASTYSEILKQLFKTFAEKTGKSRWAEKSLALDNFWPPLEIFDKSLYRLKIIHLVRDGRDACLSFCKEWNGPKTLAEAAYLWRWTTEQYRNWGVHHPGQYHEIRYEDMLNNTQQVIRGISEFMGFKPVEGVENQIKSRIALLMSKENSHPLLNSPIKKDNKEKRKTEMSRSNQYLFEFIAGETLLKFGYPLMKKPPKPAIRLAIYGYCIQGMLLRYLSLNYYLRRIRDFLPALIWCAQKVHLKPSVFITRKTTKYNESKKKAYKDYWEKNIQGFSGFYDKNSEENISAPWGISHAYKTFIFPVERMFMRDRYNIVSDYISQNIHSGMKVADIGCGNGIFTKKIANRGAKVYAIDYTQSALDLTKSTLSKDESKNVELMKLDITSEHIPAVDAAISIGTIMYVEDRECYFDNILPYTPLFLFSFLESSHPLNVFRKIVPVLDVRHYFYHRSSNIKNDLEKRGFKISSKIKLATGFIVDAKRKQFLGENT